MSGSLITISQLVPTGDNRLYVVGNFTQFSGTSTPNGLVCLNSDGTINSTFQMGSGFNGPVSGVVLATDNTGDVFVYGNFTTYQGTTTGSLVRLHVSGSLASFNTGAGFNAAVTLAVLTPNGSQLLVAGSFTSYNGSATSNLVRLSSTTGAIDSTFVAGGFTGYSGYQPAIRSLLALASGEIYVGGLLGKIGSMAVPNLVRLTSTGSLDTAFNVGVGPQSWNSGNLAGSVKGIANTGDGTGDIYIWGYFTSVNGVTTGQLARLSATGSVL
jgi:hypothetical protein